jgi:hypothetical protein
MRTSKKTSRRQPRAARPSDSTAKSLEQRIAELERLVGSQREQLTQQQELLAAQGTRLAALDADPAAATAQATSAVPGHDGEPNPTHCSRRTMLKLGGIAAAAALAGASTDLARPGVAHAAGTAWLTGTVNADNQTKVLPVNNFPDPVLLDIRVGSNTTAPKNPLSGQSQAAIAAYDVSVGGVQAIYVDSINGSGLIAHSDSAFGVNGISNSGTGVSGVSNSGMAVQGTSASGIGGQFAGGQAQLKLEPAGASGAPSSGAHAKGEIVLDLDAAVWVCVGNGTPGTWVRLGTATSQGGAINYLAAPVRILAAINGATGSLVNRPALGPLEIFALTVAGLSGSGIPASAKGLIANITVLGPSQGGNLSLFPAGAPIPTVASMTYGQGMYLANGVNVAIGTSGQVNIQNQSNGTTPLVLDAVAYVG